MAELQTLFSLEVDVEFVHVQPSGVICRIPAVAFRLMDFPTLLIHHVTPANVKRIKESVSSSPAVRPPSQLKELKDHRGNFVFKKGKSCLFKSSINNLLGHLRNAPLYVMVLDMLPTTPKLVGNCSVPLQCTMESIAADVERTGVSVPTVHGTKDYYKVYNLMGSEIGYISLGFKLLSLGAGLISHIPESSITKPVPSTSKNIESSKISSGEMARHSGDVVLENIEEFSNTDKYPIEIYTATQENDHVEIRSSSTQTRRRLVKSRQKTHTKYVSIDQGVQEDGELGLFVTNTICPPPLFFNSRCEDLPTDTDKLSSKKAPPPKPEDSEDSFSSAGFVETHYVFPPDSQQSVRKVHRKSHYKASDNVDVKDQIPDSCSVGVQSLPDVRTIASGLINQNLPILAALLRELSVLQSNRPVNQQPGHLQPGHLQPGHLQPGHLQPGHLQPGHLQPGHLQPGHLQPGHSSHHHTISTPRAAVPMTENDLRNENVPSVRAEVKQIHKAKDSHRQRPSSTKTQTRLKFGMTHSQKLRLQRNNPELLKTLEKEESKQKRDQRVMGSTYKTPNKASKRKTENPRQRSNQGNRKLDASSQESESNKENAGRPKERPVPAPRRSKDSLTSRSTETGPVPEKEEIKSYMSVSGFDQEMSGNETKSSHHDSKDGSETSSRRIEVHIPSVSNYTNESDSDRTGDFTDQSDDVDITIGHVSPKKIVQYPGFGNVSESAERNEKVIINEGKPACKGYVETVGNEYESENRVEDVPVMRIEVLPKPDITQQSDESESAADGEMLEGAQFEVNYSTDFDVVGGEGSGGKDDVLEYAEFEGSYSYEFEVDDHSKGYDVARLEVVDDQEVDSLASLSTTTSSSSEQSESQRSLRHPMAQNSRLQRGSLAMPKPTLSSKSPLPNKKTSANGSNLFQKTTADTRRNVDVSMNLATVSSGHSGFLTGDSDILQSTAGTGRTRSSDDNDPSFSDLLTDGSREF